MKRMKPKSLAETAGEYLAQTLGRVEAEFGSRIEEFGETSAFFTWEGRDYQVALKRYVEDESLPHKAVKEDHPIQRMTKFKSVLGMKRRFSQQEMSQIVLGFVPPSMDDRWFVYFDSRRSHLRIHRSWGGFCIFILKLEQDEDGAYVSNSWVNRNPAQYGNSDLNYDVSVANWIVDTLLLKIELEFPTQRI